MSILKYLVNLKTLFYFFFSILFIWIGIYLFKHVDGSHGFILGDWLVNYHDGGFKRRGLSGSLFFILQDITGLKLKTLVYSGQMILYFAFFILLGRIIYKKTISLLFFTLILSPLTFIFYFNDVNIIGRKEIILFVIFAYFIYLNDRKEFKGIKEYSVYILLCTATFLHEIFIFYMPYFLIALYLFNKETKVKQYVFLFLSVLLPTFLIFFAGGLINEGESLVILSQRGVDFNSDKINIFDFTNTLLSSLDRYKSAPVSYSLYLVSLILGLLHFSYYLKTESRENFKILIKGFLFSLVYSLPLFVLVCDWGRWLQIHFILLLVILAAKLPLLTNGGNSSFKFFLKKKELVFLILLIPFFFTWRIYHFKFGFSLDGMFYFAIKKLLAII
ncbi:hypothetical protein [Flavivirga spongiicola]|uniref:EpsG family protein n=1 Tax=Flavivirga spongiicola TaxID=421621 RepID=A0ABU7Y046_9FLAO|nr:hypothetical protein [Flavivirga sp. MEBiC05379]MDO5980494.1 hypothetical protein [Flavivirga sp. MEBiC05379]